MKRAKITPKLIKEHGLTKEEYARIKEILGREPNLTELGIFSVMWSEHCSYKSSKIHLRNFPTTGERVLEGPGENAGVVDIGDGLALVFKMESHNHPSFIEPFQGAATGVGGILRDVFTMGARPIASLNSLRFGAPDHPKTPYLLKGVVSGIAFYGNCMGIPTVGGEVYFDPSYNNNILVNAFTVGLAKHSGIFRGRASGVGNKIMYVGSKTGRDGIHGATMASDEFKSDSESKRPNVQIGDPFTEKLLLEACLEAFQTGAIVGIQDMGAAGLTSSSFEMASRAGTGIVMDLDKVPTREENMTPYEMLLSESQERMLLVVERGREEEVVRVFKKWDLDAVTIGEVTSSGRMEIFWHGDKVVDLPIAPIAHSAPVYSRETKAPSMHETRLDLSSIPVPCDMNEVLLRLISHPSIASKEWIWTQYDHMVGTDTVVLPGSDAAVMRIKGTPKGIGLTVDCNSRYCYLDPYWGAALAVFECMKNLACSGARGIAITDCLNFGNPEKPTVMWQFEQAVLGISEAARRFDTPVVSGNVSFYNETNGVPIYPTPTIAMVGLIEDVKNFVTSCFKDEGDVIILLGKNAGEVGGSEYLASIHDTVGGIPPSLDYDVALRLIETCLAGIRRGIVKSAHDTSEGGLAVALAEASVCGKRPLGAVVELKDDLRRDFLLFGEDAMRIIVTTAPNDSSTMLEIAKSIGLHAEVIGLVGGTRFKINDWIDIPVSKILEAWSSGIYSIFNR